MAGGQVEFHLDPGEYQIVPGDVVRTSLVGSDPLISTTHVVQDLSITSVDTGTGVVTGAAAPGSAVNVDAGDESGIVASRYPTADASGDWTADFSAPGPGPDEQDVVDLATVVVNANVG